MMAEERHVEEEQVIEVKSREEEKRQMHITIGEEEERERHDHAREHGRMTMKERRIEEEKM